MRPLSFSLLLLSLLLHVLIWAHRRAIRRTQRARSPVSFVMGVRHHHHNYGSPVNPLKYEKKKKRATRHVVRRLKQNV